MKRRVLSVVLSMVLLLAGASQAATITWSAWTLTGENDVSTNGDLLEALNFASASVDTTVGGVLFTGSNGSPAAYFSTTSSGNTDGDDYDTNAGGLPVFDVLLSGHLWDWPNAETVTISNLEVGRFYEIQLFIADTRTTYGIPSRHIVIDGGTSNEFGSFATTHFGQPDDAAGISILGTFTADSVIQAFTLNQLNDTTSEGPTLNAYQLRTSRRGAAESPNPDGTVEVDSTVVSTVSWQAPSDVNIVEVTDYNVYWSDTEPNYLTAVPVADYNFATDGTAYTPTGGLTFATTYYWRVDTHVTWDSNDITGHFTDVIEGSEWQFTTLSQYLPPAIAVDNVISAVELLPAELSATVSGNSEALVSAAFTLLDDDIDFPIGANASLNDTTSSLANPTVELTTDMAGTYKIKLVVSDGITDVEAIAEIMVASDVCEAQKDSRSSAWDQSTFDVDGDCMVDLYDLAQAASEWLDDSSMQQAESYTGSVEYIPVNNADIVLGELPLQGSSDGWPSQMMIDLGSTYTNTTGSAQTLTMQNISFVAANATDPITPFVVEYVENVGDPLNPNQFTVVAIGDTRTPADYDTGHNLLDFSDTPQQITVDPGETIACGFVDAYPDGTGKVSSSVVIFEGGTGDIWKSEADNIGASGSVSLGAAPVPGGSPVWQDRNYSFQVGFDVQ